ncbi:MAG: DNA-3-methyladenine glycosylase I, partial [Alphaproteobacteria bacterium]
FGEADVARLLLDVGIIRNRRKIEAVIENARRLLAIRDAEGSFTAWLARHHPLAPDDWVKLLRGTFRFMGPEIVSEFLMSIGYLPGAHDPDCPVFAEIAALNPPWMNSGK